MYVSKQAFDSFVSSASRTCFDYFNLGGHYTLDESSQVMYFLECPLFGDEYTLSSLDLHTGSTEYLPNKLHITSVAKGLAHSQGDLFVLYVPGGRTGNVMRRLGKDERDLFEINESINGFCMTSKGDFVIRDGKTFVILSKGGQRIRSFQVDCFFNQFCVDFKDFIYPVGLETVYKVVNDVAIQYASLEKVESGGEGSRSLRRLVTSPCVDGLGNVYVIEAGNHNTSYIRVISVWGWTTVIDLNPWLISLSMGKSAMKYLKVDGQGDLVCCTEDYVLVLCLSWMYYSKWPETHFLLKPAVQVMIESVLVVLTKYYCLPKDLLNLMIKTTLQIIFY